MVLKEKRRKVKNLEIGINLFCYSGDNAPDVERQIELMKENGFEHTFIMADHPQLSGGMVDKVKRAGIAFDTLHAPFNGINSMWRDGIDGDDMLKTLTDCIERCASYDIPVAVCHLSSGKPAPVINDIGNRRFSVLMETAQRKNITIAFENQRFIANIASIMEQYPEAAFCWDVGHEGCFTRGIRFMELFGNRLAAVHLHDNHHLPDGDEHLIPFDGITNYNTVAETLAKYSFGGTVMLEVFKSESNRYEGFSPEQYYRHAGESARRLATMIEQAKCEA